MGEERRQGERRQNFCAAHELLSKEVNLIKDLTEDLNEVTTALKSTTETYIPRLLTFMNLSKGGIIVLSIVGIVLVAFIISYALMVRTDTKEMIFTQNEISIDRQKNHEDVVKRQIEANEKQLDRIDNTVSNLAKIVKKQNKQINETRIINAQNQTNLTEETKEFRKEVQKEMVRMNNLLIKISKESK